MATLTKVTRIDRTNVDPSSVRSCSTVRRGYGPPGVTVLVDRVALVDPTSDPRIERTVGFTGARRGSIGLLYTPIDCHHSLGRVVAHDFSLPG
jgi:hypothetical protein